MLCNAQCNTAHSGSITKTMLCAGLRCQGSKHSCQGDSGGLIVVRGATAKHDVQVGVVSLGYG